MGRAEGHRIECTRVFAPSFSDVCVRACVRAQADRLHAAAREEAAEARAQYSEKDWAMQAVQQAADAQVRGGESIGAGSSAGLFVSC